MYNTELKNFWMFKLIVEGVKKVSVVFSDLNFWIEIERGIKKNCFDTDEVAVLDSTDIVDEYTTDCGVMVIKEMMEELD